MAEKIAAQLRNQILERDGNRCRKCNRADGLQAHHITPRLNEGADSLDNLTTLCEACHMEWHMMEISTKMSFDQWLPLPSAALLLAMFAKTWSADVTARDMQQTIIAGFEYQKQTR